ncbi:MAG TPA: cobalamin-dependent protein, partial [Thermoplasmata archaeon]|nr:cobalamin-dependent protein [Thermoplasmata archaeon]
MAMKVVLSTPPGQTTERWPPLGLLYIASNVRAHRSDRVQVIDAFCEGLDTHALVERAVKAKPDVFGINCSTHTFLSAVETLRKIREVLPEIVLVMGGFHATFAAQRILADYPFVDYVIKGEAEN